MGTHSLFLETAALSFEALSIAVGEPFKTTVVKCLADTAIAQLP